MADLAFPVDGNPMQSKAITNLRAFRDGAGIDRENPEAQPRESNSLQIVSVGEECEHFVDRSRDPLFAPQSVELDTHCC